MPTQRNAVLESSQRDPLLAVIPVDPRVSAAHATAGWDSRHEPNAPGDLREFQRICDFTQYLLIVDRTAAVETAVANHDPVGRRDRAMEASIVSAIGSATSRHTITPAALRMETQVTLRSSVRRRN